MSNIEQIISKGLGVLSAKIYLSLVQNGDLTVPEIVKKIEVSRTLIYESLTDLLAGGYVTYRKEGRVAFYGPAHPSKLSDLVEEKKREANIFENNIKEIIQSLSGPFNISQNKPGVRFFEGEDGLKKVWDDILDSGVKEFKTIHDSQALYEETPELIREWLEKKKSLGIKEKIITNDTLINHENIEKYQDKIDEIKFIDKNKNVTIENTVLDIYAGKVAYTTLEHGNIIGVIIEDKNIYKMQNDIFDLIW